MDYKMLLSPMNIGTMTVKNRIVMTAAEMSLGQTNGCPTEKMMAYYKEEIEKKHHNYKNVCLILQYYTVDTSILGEFRPDNEWLNAHNAGFTKDEFFKVAGICGVASGSLRTPLKKYVDARNKGRDIFFSWPKCC